MCEGQQRSWIIESMIHFLKGAPYSLFLVGATLWYACSDLPRVFTAARYIKMRFNLNT